MNKTVSSFIQLFMPFIVLLALAISTSLIVRFEVLVFGSDISESSVTELLQQFFLFLTVIVFFISAIKIKHERSFYILVTGFLACMLLREHDFYFDKIQHGFWFYPTILLAICTISYAFFSRNHLARSVLNFSQTQSYIYLIVGLSIVLVFSRIFGSGSFWLAIMDNNYDRLYKTIIQEGLELFGYAIVLVGGLNHAKNNLFSNNSIDGDRK